MRHVGSVVLAAVLLGLPRALDARAFGAQRSVCVEVAPQGPELTDFTTELEGAIEGAAVSLEIHAAGRTSHGSGKPGVRALLTRETSLGPPHGIAPGGLGVHPVCGPDRRAPAAAAACPHDFGDL